MRARAHARRVLVLLEAVRGLPPMVFIELSLRHADLPTVCRRLRLSLDVHSSAPPATVPVVLAGRRRRVVRGSTLLLSRWPAGDTCLRRCLLVGYRLRRLGPVLRIGVARSATGEFGAHAWLELGGATFDPAAAGFEVLGAMRGVNR